LQLKDRLLRKATLIAAGNKTIRNLIERSQISLDFPAHIFIEPTNICNLKCRMCPQAEPSDVKRGLMDFNIFKKVIDESVTHGRRTSIFFHKDGEPLIHPQLFDMISYAVERKASYRTHLSTNAQLLDEEKAEKLLVSGIDSIIVNIDANEEDTYMLIKGKGGLSEVEKNVRNLIFQRNRSGKAKPMIRVKLILVDANQEEVEEFRKKWENIADEVVIGREFQWPGSKQGESASSDSQTRRYPCISLWLSMAVNWDGSVSLCCIDYYHKGIIGDVKKNTLESIWKSDDLKKLRKAHIMGEYGNSGICCKCQGLWVRDTLGIGSEKWLAKKMKKAGLWNE